MRNIFKALIAVGLIASGFSIATAQSSSERLRVLGRNGEWVSMKVCAQSGDFPCRERSRIMIPGPSTEQASPPATGRVAGGPINTTDPVNATDGVMYCAGTKDRTCYGGIRECHSANAQSGRKCKAENY